MLAFADKEPWVVKNYFRFLISKEFRPEFSSLWCIVPILDLDESTIAVLSFEVLFFFKVDDSGGENVKLFNDFEKTIMSDVGEEHGNINIGQLTQDVVTFAGLVGHVFRPSKKV